MDYIWLNFKEMLDDIKSFLEKNSDSTIIQKDNPVKLTIGYCCEKTGKEWSIGIRSLKGSEADPISYLLLNSLKCQEGKSILLRLINSWSSNKNLSLKEIGLDCGTDKATYHRVLLKK